MRTSKFVLWMFCGGLSAGQGPEIWSPLPDMNARREFHTATLLDNGDGGDSDSPNYRIWKTEHTLLREGGSSGDAPSPLSPPSSTTLPKPAVYPRGGGRGGDSAVPNGVDPHHQADGADPPPGVAPILPLSDPPGTLSGRPCTACGCLGFHRVAGGPEWICDRCHPGPGPQGWVETWTVPKEGGRRG